MSDTRSFWDRKYVGSNFCRCRRYDPGSTECYKMYVRQGCEIENEVKEKRDMQYVSCYKSPIGNMTMTSDGKCLTGLWFDDGKVRPNAMAEDDKIKVLPIFDETCRWLDTYFSGKDPGRIPVVRLYGTEFRSGVWKILQSIPYGQTVTYGEIAKKMAAQMGLPKMSAQAVGGAVGHNPISIIIPCHRVIGTDGSLTGYVGGLDKKLAMLRLEGLSMSSISEPVKGKAH